MPEDPEDPETDQAAGLPTRLPAAVLPGAYTSAVIDRKISEAVAGLQDAPNAIEVGVKYKKAGEAEVISAALALKLEGGWAVYGQAGIDLHNGDLEVEGGVKKTW